MARHVGDPRNAPIDDPTDLSAATQRALRTTRRLGGYVVVESTIVGGHPVWPEFGAHGKDTMTLRHEPARAAYSLSAQPDRGLEACTYAEGGPISPDAA